MSSRNITIMIQVMFSITTNKIIIIIIIIVKYLQVHDVLNPLCRNLKIFILIYIYTGDVLSRGCTSGFMSVDRMERVLGLYGPQDVVQSFNATSIQAVFPGMNFTCSGSIQSWIFGAEWFRNSPAYTELQIWRKSREDSYIKVGSTEIRIELEESTRYYEYTLSSPLSYQTGDVVGYFQASSSTSQWGLLYENVESGHLLYYSVRSIPANTFNILTSVPRGDVRPIITLTTGNNYIKLFTDMNILDN